MSLGDCPDFAVATELLPKPSQSPAKLASLTQELFKGSVIGLRAATRRLEAKEITNPQSLV